MFCKKCGRDLQGTELICPACGTPVSEVEKVFGGNNSIFGNSDILNKESRIEDIVWDVDVFPDIDSRKTEEINFDWGNKEEEFPEIFDSAEKIYDKAEEPPKLDDIYRETKKPASPVFSDESDKPSENIDKFYTFSQKNEDFQKMLEAELSKLEDGNSIAFEQGEADRITEENFVPGKPIIRDELDELFAKEGLSTDVPEQRYSPQLSDDPEFEKRMRQMEIQDKDAAAIEEKLAVSAEDANRKPEIDTAPDLPESERFIFDTLPDIMSVSAIDEVKLSDFESTDDISEAAEPAAEFATEPAAESRFHFEEDEKSRFDFSQLEALNDELLKANAEVEEDDEINVQPVQIDDYTPVSEPVYESVKEAIHEPAVFEPQNQDAFQVKEPAGEMDLSDIPEFEHKEPAEHIREMHEARATFFGQMDSLEKEGLNEFDWGTATVTLDKQSIKEALAETDGNSEAEAASNEIELNNTPLFAVEQPVRNIAEAAKQSFDIEQQKDPAAEKSTGKKKKGSTVLKIIIIILALILLIEFVIIGIKYFADTSNAAKWIDAKAVTLIDFFNGSKSR